MDKARNLTFPIYVSLLVALVSWHAWLPAGAYTNRIFQPNRGETTSTDFSIQHQPYLDTLSPESHINQIIDSLSIVYKQQGQYLELADLYLFKSRKLRNQDKYEQAHQYVNDALQLINEKTSSKTNSLSVKAYKAKGGIYQDEINPGMELESYMAAMQLAKEYYGEIHLEIADINILIADVYAYTLRDHFQAEIYYESAKKILDKLPEVSYEKEFQVTYNLASANRNQEDYEKAVNYGHRALSIVEDQQPIDSLRWVYGLQIVANSYNDYPDNEEKGLPYYKKLLTIFPQQTEGDSINLGNLYKNIGICYQSAENYDSSLLYLQKSREILEKFSSPNNVVANDFLINTYSSLGLFYSERENYSEARAQLYKAIVLSQKYYGAFDLRAGKAYHTLSEVYYKQGLYSSSLKSIRKSLLCRSKEWNPSSLNENPKIEQLLERSRTQETFILKGKNYLKLYEQTGKTQFLHNALYTFNYADELLHFMRSSYSSDNTILTNAELYKALYENALTTIYELALKSQNKQYLDLAFLFMEKNSAGLLLENLIAAENKFEVGVSDSLIRAERNLRAEADRIQSVIHNHESSNTDVVKHRDELYSLNQKLDDLEGEIADRFPAYYNIKYQNQDFASLSDIQENLTKGDLYVSYYVGKDAIFLLGVQKESGTKLIKIDYDQKLKEAFTRVLAVYSDQSNSHYHYKSYESFVNDSYYLYSQLLEPVIANQNADNLINNLIIVTNGELGLLPFESLLTDNHMSANAVDYRSLSYLIKSYRIQYTYSGTLFGRHPKGKLKQNRAKVLAFGYSDDDGSANGVRDELKGSVYELRALQNMLVGDFLQGSRATETAFKAKAQTSDILHLALHGEANRQNPLGSALYFRSQSDTANDGRLYPYELYPLNLNSRLVVLSSCETGIGKSYSGEGIYSIGRSFSYAGCPSIVMTLWKLNDRITADIMKDFYKGLTKGQELDESLRRSKLNYLQEADELTAHPVNWAAFVAIGDMSPIRPMERKNSFYLMIAIALIIPTVILALKMLLFSKK